jgi:hypothetical protein
VLDSPESFGLGKRASDLLINALTPMRKNLKEELIEPQAVEPEGDLSAELSQHTDDPVVINKKRRMG